LGRSLTFRILVTEPTTHFAPVTLKAFAALRAGYSSEFGLAVNCFLYNNLGPLRYRPQTDPKPVQRVKLAAQNSCHGSSFSQVKFILSRNVFAALII
jgi:hypothetical protein